MKRRNDGEKIREPMFPRLHVNDTERGGPRAPPRNKMALYEQLSIPSQRCNLGLLPLNPNDTASGVHPASSSHGGDYQKGMFSPPHLNRSTAESYAGCSNLNLSSTQVEQKKKLDEEDFIVPIFVRSETGWDHSKNSNDNDGEKEFPSSPSYLGCSMEIQIPRGREPKQASTTVPNVRREGKNQNKENPKEQITVVKQSVKSVKRSSARENSLGPLKQTAASAHQEHRDCFANNFDRLQSTGADLRHEYRSMSQLNNSMCKNDVSNESEKSIENGLSSNPSIDSCPEELGSANNSTFHSLYHEDETDGHLHVGNEDRGDDASETSMVDSEPSLDISPDDVVGIIGQKHFWKARRAISNQQRVFAVQIFELHRLIKVQRSFAGSPHLLLEYNAYLGKPSKGSAAKEVPVEFIIKPSPRNVKHKADSDNPNQKMECSAENAVGRTTPSVQNISHPSNYMPLSGNPPSTPVITDVSCFHQPPGQQWLIPVMSPSEGLIYKPYHPGHGFTGPLCGGYGFPGSNPVMGNFINAAYGVPYPHHHYPGYGVPPTTPVSHGYFPPYGMPFVSPVNSGSAVEQANDFAGLSSCGDLPSQLSGGRADFSTQYQSSCNVLTQKIGAFSNVVKPHATKESELQACTASSPGERTRGTGLGHTTEGRNAMSLSPTSRAAHVPEGGAPQLNDTDLPTRVIRVVPHNAVSATESAARIFQSIQEERKQYDSV